MKNPVTYDDVAKLMDIKLGVFSDKLDSKLLTWKSEIVDAVDTMAKEIRDNREFRAITTNQIVEDRERIGKLEKRVFGV